MSDGAATLHLGDPHHKTSLRMISPVGTNPGHHGVSSPAAGIKYFVLKSLSSTAGAVGFVSGLVVLSMERSFMLHVRMAGKIHWKDDVKLGEYMPKPLCSGNGVGFQKWCLNSLKCWRETLESRCNEHKGI